MPQLVYLGKKLPKLDPKRISPDPDWKQCDAGFIRRALNRALERPSGNWYVLDGSREITNKPRLFVVDGRELVAYRIAGDLRVGMHACPHIGGPLASGRVENGKLVCPWHGLALPHPEHEHWKPLDSFDDGVLCWVRVGEADADVPEPIRPARPERFVDAVIRKEARAEASDIIANRLDPWHGAHYHPHTFAALTVTEVDEDRLTLRVAYRLAGKYCIEVDATFHSPEPRTIVMTIIDGEGAGSIVETHSTPIAPGRSAVVEATLATSDRPGFGKALKAAGLIRPWMVRAAHRLWVEDVAYAERVHALRSGGSRQ